MSNRLFLAICLIAFLLIAGFLGSLPAKPTSTEGFSCDAGKPKWVWGEVYCLVPARKDRP